jgi:long-chain acyl-CoA synthetase
MTAPDRTFQPAWHARNDPERVAVVLEPSGQAYTYRDLEDRSARLANALRSAGLRPGDHLALMSSNHLDVAVVVWAAQRCGLYYTPLNPQLSPEEAAYIIDDCDARVFVVGDGSGDGSLVGLAETLIALTPKVELRVSLADRVAGHRPLDELLAEHGPVAAGPEVEGTLMGYTSGTTGQPKGVLRPIGLAPVGSADPLAYLADRLGLDGTCRYLVTAGLYHAAPCAWMVSCLRRGATVVLLHRFDARSTLRILHERQITHALFVPTMFVRLLKLPAPERSRWDLGRLRSALHVGAPCPPEVKRAMIDWWGPIVDEFYAGTEAMGATFLRSDEWLDHPGSVGRAVRGVVHITDDEGVELGPGETGWVWFESDAVFKYHNDPDKTAAAHNQRGWSKLGDLGYLDADGYLYLTDRASFTVISGGVNIYPQEIENALALHPKIADVAVFGVPDDELGEAVHAVVQPETGIEATAALVDEVLAYGREHLARYKCPRSVSFTSALPRQESGKLAKSVVRASYLADPTVGGV